MKYKLESRFPGEISITSDMHTMKGANASWPHFYKESPFGDQCASKGALLPFLMLLPGRTTSISSDYATFLYFYFQESPTPKF